MNLPTKNKSFIPYLCYKKKKFKPFNSSHSRGKRKQNAEAKISFIHFLLRLHQLSETIVQLQKIHAYHTGIAAVTRSSCAKDNGTKVKHIGKANKLDEANI